MDPYAAVLNIYFNPSFLDDDLPVPNFDLQYSLPSINYYLFKPSQESVENGKKLLKKTQTPTTSGSAPQIPLNPVPDISNIDFVNDSLTFKWLIVMIQKLRNE